MDIYLEQAIQNSGNVDYKKINSKHIRNALEDRKNKIGASLNFLKAMRSLFKWATSNEYVAVNPCLPKNKSEGFKPWTKEDMIQFQEYWKEGSIPRLSFEFLFFTGLRSSDACRTGYQHLKGNVFSIQTQKVGTIVTIELPDSFMQLLEITPIGKDSFFVNREKEKMSAHQFTLWFRDKARKAGIKKSAHGVRKLSATLSAESGATAHELMAVYGWKSISQAEVYTKGADRIELGKKASRRMAFSVNKPEPKK